MPKKSRRLPRIPDDVWREIAQFAATSLHVLFGMWTISKHFRHILTHPVMLSHMRVCLVEPRKVAHLGTLATRIRSLRFEYADDDSFSFLLPPTVTDLNLAGSSITEQGLAAALRGLGGLTHLNVSDCNIDDCNALANLPLVKLAVGGSFSDFRDADQLFPTLPNLRELDISAMCLCSDPFDRHRTESMCVQAISKLTNLHTLNLEASDLHDREFLKLASLATTLKILSVAHTDITDKSAHVLSKFGRLESLAVSGCHLSKRGLRAISKLQQLRVLNASDCPRMVRDDSLVAIAPLSLLEHLDISCNPIQCFEPLYGLVNLRTLDVSACDQVYAYMNGYSEWDIKEEARQALARHMPWLVVKSSTKFL